MEGTLSSVANWLEANSVLLGALGSLAAVLALFLVNGAQALGALFKKKDQKLSEEAPDDDASGEIDVSKPVPGFGGSAAVAVLPFANLSDDPEQGYFADGISEDILTGLQAFRTFPVIARSTTFAYKDKSVDIREIARELGVGYVLEGSVRKMGERVRITAQLVDHDGVHIWAEKFDRALSEIFEVQDEITQHIVSAISPEMHRAHTRRNVNKAPADLKAWDYYLKAQEAFRGPTREELPKILDLAAKAIEIDPEFSLAYSLIAGIYGYNQLFFDGKAVEDASGEASDLPLTYARKAVEMDRAQAVAHRVLGLCLMRIDDYDGALHECQEAKRLNPSDAVNYSSLAMVLASRGDYEDALAEIETAIRLSPKDEMLWGFFQTQARSNYGLGRYEEAVGVARKSLRLRPTNQYANVNLIASLVALDRLDDAKAAYTDMRTAIPEFSSETLKLADAIKVPYLAALKTVGWEG
jgi:adenylate cyclase